ncbi:MAG: DUF1614 domain-containing protein [Candidatus Brocadiia bacterium]
MQRTPFGCLALGLMLFGMLLLPFLLTDLMLGAMQKLGLTPGTSLLVVMGILLGSFINIPVRKIPRGEKVEMVPVQMFGLGRIFPRMVRRQTYTVIAVNLGGCVVPCAVAAYQVLRLVRMGFPSVLAAGTAVALNIVICYKSSRPVRNVGITMRPFIPAITAALSAMILLPQFAPPVAFVAGVTGPLVGADFMHMREINKTSAGMASIGGAGTFDGIVISGLVATLLA